MEQLRHPTQERMSPVEAEEVIRRFREEEELRQQELEAQATNPTVADLAEGLGVSADRIAALLAQVRRDTPPPIQEPQVTSQEAQEYVRSQNRNAWIIAAAIAGSILVLLLFFIAFVATPEVKFEATPATESVPAADVAVPSEVPDAVAEAPTSSAR